MNNEALDGINNGALRACVDDIITQTLTTWYRARIAPQGEAMPSLNGALAAIAQIDGRCEMLPTSAWLHTRFRANDIEESAPAVMDAICRMTPTFHAPEKLVSTALLALRSSDRFLQARGAGALALLGARLHPTPDLTSALRQCWEDNRHDSGHASDITRDAPAHPARLAQPLQCLGSNPSGFTRAVVLTACGQTPACRHEARVLAMLQAGLQDRMWCVARVAAEAALRLGVHEPLARAFQQTVTGGAWEERARALRALGHLAGAGDTSSAQFLRERLRLEDVTQQLTIAESLAQCGRTDADAALTALRALLTGSDPLTRPFIERYENQLQTARGLRCDVTAALLHLLQGAGYDPNAVEQAAKQERACATHSARTDTAKEAAGRDPSILLIRFVLEEGMRANAPMEADLATIIQDTPAFRQAQPDIAQFSGPGYVGLACFGKPEALFDTAVAITEAIKQPGLPPPRMALHTGAIHATKDAEGCRQIEGMGVVNARSVADCGEPGHILVTAAARDALAATSPYHALLDDLGHCSVPQRGSLHLYNLYDGKRSIGYAAWPGLKSPRVRSGRRKRPLAIFARTLPLLISAATVGVMWYAAYRFDPSLASWKLRLNTLLHSLQPVHSSSTSPTKNIPRPGPHRGKTPGKPHGSSSADTNGAKSGAVTLVPTNGSGSVTSGTPIVEPASAASVDYHAKYSQEDIPPDARPAPDDRILYVTLRFYLRSHRHNGHSKGWDKVRLEVEGADWENEDDAGPLQTINNGVARYRLHTTNRTVILTPTLIFTDRKEETLRSETYIIPSAPARNGVTDPGYPGGSSNSGSPGAETQKRDAPSETAGVTKKGETE